MPAKRFTNPSNIKGPVAPEPVLPDDDQPYTAGYLRGLRPSEVTFEVMMGRLRNPEFNPLAGLEPTIDSAKRGV